ncbi:MAG TPA: GDSL-type esterase/lipase family protein, partial [Chitinophagaceae bacterium]|nr:GDSL-type esterase/lipase family protein [Chitinophagaceae bacterium]
FGFSCSVAKERSNYGSVLLGKDLQAYGRCRVDSLQNIHLISSAVHFGFRFEGKDCKIFASLPDVNSHNYIQYELDGKYVKRIKIDGRQKEPIIFSAPTPGKHTVIIYKATEAHTGDVIIEKIEGKKISALAITPAPLIEFIGNSITCGAAADASEVACGTGSYHDQHNAYQAYGPRVARELNTHFILSSVSGIGIYRNWNSDGPAMPKVYEKTDFRSDGATLWNFNQYTPRVVSIALGTNDFSNGDGKRARAPFDSAAFVTAYIKFVNLVVTKYPTAQVALLSSAMVNGPNRVLLQNCLEAVKSVVDAKKGTTKPIALYFFKPMQARGCSGHPSVEDHEILASELVPFFKSLLL